MAEKLTDIQIDDALAKLDGWAKVEGEEALYKSFAFVDFDEAWEFMTQVAALAGTMNHHPEWRNSYSCVDVTLTTHDSNGITQKDIEMAEAMNRYSA